MRDNGKQISLKEMLDLPEGYKALQFISTIEIEGPGGLQCAIAVPYDAQSIHWWREQAELKIKEALLKSRLHV